MQNIVIVGSSGHARVVIDIVNMEGRYRVAGLIDRFREIGAQTLGYAILGREEDLPRLVAELSLAAVIVAIGDNFTRSQVVAQIGRLCPGLAFVSAVHPRANVARDVRIGEGTVVMAGATINPCCVIADHCILNSNTSLDHDSTMASFSSLAPGVSTGGNVTIGAFSAICIGATIVAGLRIGEHCVVGAGATVLADIGPYQVAYGTPARVVRERKPGDQYL